MPEQMTDQDRMAIERVIWTRAWRRGVIPHARILNDRVTRGRGQPTYEEQAVCGFEPVSGWNMDEREMIAWRTSPHRCVRCLSRVLTFGD